MGCSWAYQFDHSCQDFDGCIAFLTIFGGETMVSTSLNSIFFTDMECCIRINLKEPVADFKHHPGPIIAGNVIQKVMRGCKNGSSVLCELPDQFVQHMKKGIVGQLLGL